MGPGPWAPAPGLGGSGAPRGRCWANLGPMLGQCLPQRVPGPRVGVRGPRGRCWANLGPIAANWVINLTDHQPSERSHWDQARPRIDCSDGGGRGQLEHTWGQATWSSLFQTIFLIFESVSWQLESDQSRGPSGVTVLISSVGAVGTGMQCKLRDGS